VRASKEGTDFRDCAGVCFLSASPIACSLVTADLVMPMCRGNGRTEPMWAIHPLDVGDLELTGVKPFSGGAHGPKNPREIHRLVSQRWKTSDSCGHRPSRDRAFPAMASDTNRADVYAQRDREALGGTRRKTGGHRAVIHHLATGYARQRRSLGIARFLSPKTDCDTPFDALPIHTRL